MARLSIFFCLTLFFIILIPSAAPDQSKEDEVYIVYMGGKRSSSPGTLRDDQALLLNSFSERNAVVHVYKHGFTGFAARMSKEEANFIAQHPGVVSVFPDKKVKLLTTRSWSFLQQLSNLTLPRSTTAKGADTIIAILDTGIWPESKSFSDENMGPVPKRWIGTCVETQDFPASSCNRKLIGARHFDDRNKTCRDFDGHGTHTASTAAGAPVPGVSYYGLAEGTAIGGSPSSRIAVYKICYEGGCEKSAILAGMDAAINDGVDIMSLSLGGDPEDSAQILHDSLAIGGFHAIEHGITVVCAGGNAGPYESSVTNFTPWLTTVAASTIDRHFESNVVLGNNQEIKGGCIMFPGLSESPKYPLIDALSAKSASPETPDSASRNCLPGSLDGSKIKGKIVLCFNEEESSGKVKMILGQGGLGVILVDDVMEIASMQPTVVDFPLTSISSDDGNVVLSYIKSNRNPTATILRSATSVNYKPAPSIVFFSSRGPSYLTHNLLKPDISAPGLNIIAAWRGMDNSKAIPGRKSPEYVIESGTSMATPHISGVAALVKSQHPTWDHSAIRSAIMTTAIQTDSDGVPVTKFPGLQKATPYDFGAGEVNIAQAIDPGLIYETSTMDYYIFLCNIGYNESQIMLIAGKMPQEFSCPKDASEDSISNMNYPSIAVANFNKTMYKKVTRTVTNVGDEDETVYSVIVDPPQYLNVQVIPEKLEFTKENKKKSFDVIFSTEYHYQSDVFGWITCSNGKYRVRSPFAISINNSRR